MEYIGFFALLVLGGWMAFAAFSGAFAAYVFARDILWPVVIIGCIGVVIVVATLYHSPFSIVVKGG